MQLAHILATVQDEFMTLLISVILDSNVFDIEVIISPFMFRTVYIDQSICNTIHSPIKVKCVS